MSEGFARRAAAAALTGALALVAVGAAGTPAFAKSEVGVSVTHPAVRLGQRLGVRAYGGDDGVRWTYLCIDQRVGGGPWRQVGCGARNVHRVVLSVRATRRGALRYRGRLLAMRYRGRHLTVDRISGSTAVIVY